ncbi:MAG: T9SS type A sorting domain-containing protein [Bacteroidota bacterium]
MLLVTTSLNAQVFVKYDAMGTNDGTSWENAYTDLSDALDNSNQGDQIWVAAGTYKPGGADATQNSHFAFPHDLEIYGGFVGNETTLASRDWVANETILSGDHEGNDTDHNFDDTRKDNAYHVMWLTDTVTNASVIDGFTIRNGNTEPQSGSGNFRRGGGILTYGAPTIRNCYFTQNYGYFGGGVYPRNTGAAGIIIEDCVFEHNAGGSGAGLYIRTTSAVVTNCIFKDNTVQFSGGGFYNNAAASTVSNCSFENNTASYGGGLYATGVIFTGMNCTFEGNVAAESGGGLLTDAESATLEALTFENNSANWGGGLYNYTLEGTLVTDCIFNKNVSLQGRGGGVFNYISPSTYTNCTFTNNEAAASSGGAIQILNDNPDVAALVTIEDCGFDANAGLFGGALASYGATSEVYLQRSTFKDNEAANVGGAISNGFGAMMNIEDVSFVGNESQVGGAIFCQNDESVVSVTGSTISGNIASMGGGVAVEGDMIVGSMAPTVNIKNTYFTSNVGENNGGGINITDGNAHITNVLFSSNVNTETNGAGGAISIYSFDSLENTISLLNNTIVNNFGSLGAGIVHSKIGDEGASILRVQNNIFHNPNGNNYEIGEGAPSVISEGGNISADASMNGFLLSNNDFVETDPKFIDFDDEDYRLQKNSPGVDNGIAVNAPEKDLLGMGRVGNIDIGAFENQQTTTAIIQIEKSFGALTIFPNPIQDDLNVTFESEWKGTLNIQLTDTKGKVIWTQFFEKNEDVLQQTFGATQLPKGVYSLTISNGNEINTQRFVK